MTTPVIRGPGRSRGLGFRNRRWRAGAMAAAVFVLSGCASVREVKQQRDVLAAKLAVTEDRVKTLERDKTGLERQIHRLTGITNVLERENAERIRETSGVRGEARAYIRDQVESLRAFSQARQLMDYIGGELLARSSVAGEGLLLLDLKHRLPSDAILVGGRLYAQAPTRVAFCLARPQEKTFVVLWKSDPFTIDTAGLAELTFDAPIAAQAGDVIGLYSPDAVQVPFDDATGDARAVRLNPAAGKVIEHRALTGNPGRAYSFGVVGFLK